MVVVKLDTKVRSWTKSLTWRILGISILMVIGWLFTESIAEASLITLTFHIIRVVLYYFHERVWLRVKWNGESKFWFYFWLVLLILSFTISAYLGA